MSGPYAAGIWRDHADARNTRWAVCGPTGCWSFPARYGEQAARQLAAQMNTAISAEPGAAGH